MLGYNYRMTDIQAAVGREQLRRLPEIVARRRALAARYSELARGHRRDLNCRRSRNGRGPTGRAIACGFPQGWTSGRHAGDARCRGQHPARHHVQPPRGSLPRSPLPHALPESERAQDQCVLLPLYPA